LPSSSTTCGCLRKHLLPRRGIGQFFDRQFQPGDLGMLVTTSGAGISQLTYSPKILKAASSRLRYSLWDVQAASALAPIDGVDWFRRAPRATTSNARLPKAPSSDR
jgi:hypothetical protein